MIEIANPQAADTGPGLQSAPVSLDTNVFPGVAGQDPIASQQFESELQNRYDLPPETSAKLSEIIDVVPESSRDDLREALAHHKITPADRAELINSVHALLATERNSELQSPGMRLELATSLLHTLADPLSAHQSDRRTCSVVSSVQTRMALENPAEYARLIEGLSGKDGSVELASGERMQFVAGSARVDVPLNGDSVISRSLESRVLQSACMQYAAGYERNATGELVLQYDPARDVFHDTVHGNDTSGVYGNWQQKLTNDVFNEGSTRLDTSNVPGVGTPPREVISAMQQQLDATGTPVAVEVNWASQGDHSEHIMLVTEIKDGRVYFFNGWRTFHDRDGSTSHSHEMTEDGKVESMSLEDFEKRLRSAYIADPSKTAAEAELTDLQTERQYNPTDPTTYDIHIAPPAETYENKSETSASTSARLLEEEKELGRLIRNREDVANSARDTPNASSHAAAQQRSQSGSFARTDEDIFS